MDDRLHVYKNHFSWSTGKARQGKSWGTFEFIYKEVPCFNKKKSKEKGLIISNKKRSYIQVIEGQSSWIYCTLAEEDEKKRV